MSQNEKAESIDIDGLDIEDISLGFERDSSEPIESIRSRVSLTRDAARAISITALETLREGAKFMGVVGLRGGLKNPFGHIDAAIWKENRRFQSPKKFSGDCLRCSRSPAAHKAQPLSLIHI